MGRVQQSQDYSTSMHRLLCHQINFLPVAKKKKGKGKRKSRQTALPPPSPSAGPSLIVLLKQNNTQGHHQDSSNTEPLQSDTASNKALSRCEE